MVLDGKKEVIMTTIVNGCNIYLDFDSAFEPILVMGDDGNKYNIIPSDQFE